MLTMLNYPLQGVLQVKKQGVNSNQLGIKLPRISREDFASLCGCSKKLHVKDQVSGKKLTQ